MLIRLTIGNYILKKKIQKYHPFFAFLIKFLIVYTVLVIGYKKYLDQYDKTLFEVDQVTRSVSEMASKTIEILGYSADIQSHPTEQSMVLFINQKPIVRIIEGCNAISVMVIFIAFLIGYSGSIKNTVWFAFFGLLVIFILNIVRIVVISIALFHAPKYEHFLHEIVFPLIIYGITFLLWIVWVNQFSYHAKDAK